MSHIETIFQKIRTERKRQDQKWGKQQHPDAIPLERGGGKIHFCSAMHGIDSAREAKIRCEEAFQRKQGTWTHILTEEIAEAVEEAITGDLKKLEDELVQCGAVIVAWIEDIRDRRATCESGA